MQKRRGSLARETAATCVGIRGLLAESESLTGADPPQPKPDPVVVVSRAAFYLGLLVANGALWWCAFQLFDWAFN